MSEIPVTSTQAEMWVILADRRTVRLHIPPVRLAGLAEPLELHLDWNATAVDEILDRLTALRSQMDPPPLRS